MDIKKLSNSDKKEILSKIDNTLDSHLRKAYDWIHTDEGQIIVNVIQSLSSYAVGNPIGLLTPSIIQSADLMIRKRFLKRVPNLMDKLDKVSPQINEDFLKSDTGQNLLRQTLTKLIEEENDEKSEMYKRFLINCYTNLDVKKERISTYMNILTSLEPIQLKILGVLCKPEETVERILEKRDYMQTKIPIALKNDVKRLLVIDEEIFERAITKLESEKIISREGLEILWCSGEYPNHYENEARIRMIDTLKRFVTDFGKDFVIYVTETS